MCVLIQKYNNIGKVPGLQIADRHTRTGYRIYFQHLLSCNVKPFLVKTQWWVTSKHETLSRKWATLRSEHLQCKT